MLSSTYLNDATCDLQVIYRALSPWTLVSSSGFRRFAEMSQCTSEGGPKVEAARTV